MTLKDLEQGLRVNNQLNTDHIERLIDLAKEEIATMTYVAIGMIGIAIIIGIIIIYNQIKIKKMLKKMMDEKKKDGGEAN